MTAGIRVKWTHTKGCCNHWHQDRGLRQTLLEPPAGAGPAHTLLSDLWSPDL